MMGSSMSCVSVTSIICFCWLTVHQLRVVGFVVIKLKTRQIRVGPKYGIPQNRALPCPARQESAGDRLIILQVRDLLAHQYPLPELAKQLVQLPMRLHANSVCFH
eukprot:Selendium_serpulae@DN5835_c0_g1_i5.p1